MYSPKLPDNSVPLNLVLGKVICFGLREQHSDTIFEINECLLKESNFSLKLPLLEKQKVILRDANKHASYVLFIGNYTDEGTGGPSKFALVAFSSKRFSTGQMPLTMLAKEFFAMHPAFVHCGHMWRGTRKPIIVMTDNEALTMFFSAKHVPRRLGHFVIE